MGVMASRRPEEIIGEWGVRDVTPPSQLERARLEDDRELNPLAGKPLRRRLRNFRAEPDNFITSVGGPLPYMQRLRQIEDEVEAHRERLRRAVRRRRPRTLAPDRGALGLRRGQRPDRAPQPLVSGRGAARDEPADARLREGGRPRLPARAARRRLDPRAVSSRSVNCRADVGSRSRPRARPPRPRSRGRRGGCARSRARGAVDSSRSRRSASTAIRPCACKRRRSPTSMTTCAASSSA